MCKTIIILLEAKETHLNGDPIHLGKVQPSKRRKRRLRQTDGPTHSTDGVISSKSDSVHQNVMNLLGYYNMDPNRVLNIILEALE